MSKHILIGTVVKPRPNCDVCDKPADVSFEASKKFLCATHGVEHLKRGTSVEEEKHGR
jgi:hypothetical protein